MIVRNVDSKGNTFINSEGARARSRNCTLQDSPGANIDDRSDNSLVENSPNATRTNSPGGLCRFSSNSTTIDSPDSEVVRSHGYTLRGRPHSRVFDGIRHGRLLSLLRSITDPLFDLVDSPQQEEQINNTLHPFWRMFTRGRIRHWTDN